MKCTAQCVYYVHNVQLNACAACRMRLKHFLDDMRAVLEHHATTEQLCQLPMPSSNLLFDYTASQTSLGYLEQNLSCTAWQARTLCVTLEPTSF